MMNWINLQRRKSSSAVEDIQRLSDAENRLNEQGILPPENPDRMQCAPKWDSVLAAAAEGIDLAEAMGEATGRDTMETAQDAGFFGLVYGTTQFVQDSLNIQECMDEQDRKHEAEMKEYVEKIKEEAKPSVPAYDHHAHMCRYQSANDKRYINGQPQLTLEAYNALVGVGQNPTDIFAHQKLSDMGINNGLCTGTESGGGGSGPSEGSNNSAKSCGVNVCSINDRDGSMRCTGF